MGKFIKLLAAYAPTSSNEALYDEKILKKVKKLGIEEISIDNGLLDKIYSEFKDKCQSVIICGSAGDGKTYLLRKLYEKLGGNLEAWQEEYLPGIIYQGKKITFVKDFTEMTKADKADILKGLDYSIKGDNEHLYFIAANDGILTDTLRGLGDDYQKLLAVIEGYIDHLEVNDKSLILLDLSQTSSAKNFELLLNEILRLFEIHETDCPSLKDDTIFCPIHANVKLLKQERIKEQLVSIVRTCDLNYKHITLRRLYILISNMILGYNHSDNLRIFKTCKTAIKKFEENHQAKFSASFYNNLFGENLSISASSKTPFKDLNELRIGYESRNNIDNFLLYGDISDKDLYKKKLENPFFDLNVFSKLKENYIKDGTEENMGKLSAYMKFLRRHLFFTFNQEIEWEDTTIQLKELMAYEYANDFYKNIVVILKQKKRIPKSIVKKLVLGLNRVFLGELLSSSGSMGNCLYIASSLTNSSAKLSSEIIESISFGSKGSNQDIILSLTSGFDDEYSKISLDIKYAGQIIAKLELDLHMYEFLHRVAEGVLPTSFSVEYYERVLSFKSEIINSIIKFEPQDQGFKLFELNDQDGTIQVYEILLGVNYVAEG